MTQTEIKEHKETLISIFKFGHSLGLQKYSQTKALQELEDILNAKNFICEECNSELVETISSQDIDGNRIQRCFICPKCK